MGYVIAFLVGAVVMGVALFLLFRHWGRELSSGSTVSGNDYLQGK